MQVFEASIHAAWRGKRGILWPICIQLMRGILRFALFCATYSLAVGIVGSEVTSGFAFQIGVYLFLLLFFLLLTWWIFSASCRVMWFHELAAGSLKAARRANWLGDLPVMLGLDVLFGALKWLNIGAIIFGMIGILVNESQFSLVSLSIGSVMAIVCSVLEPAVTAQRIVDGPGLLKAIGNAVGRIVRHPARTLCIRFLPSIVSLSCYSAAGWEGLTGHGMIMILLLIAGIVVSLIQPVFWTEFACIRQENS